MAYVPPEFQGSSGHPPGHAPIPNYMNRESGIREKEQDGYESDKSVVSPMNQHHINPPVAPAHAPDQIVGPLETPWWMIPGGVRPDPTGSSNH